MMSESFLRLFLLQISIEDNFSQIVFQFLWFSYIHGTLNPNLRYCLACTQDLFFRKLLAPFISINDYLKSPFSNFTQIKLLI